MKRDITLTAEPRETRGKNEARRLRVKGMVPAVVYGSPGGPVPVAVSPKEIGKILHSASAQNTIFNVEVTGKENVPVMLADWQNDPIRGTLLHVDLKRIDLTKRLKVRIPVHTFGEPKGVKIQGGLLEIINREVEIECIPDEIPEEFKMDVAELMIGQNLRASDVALSGSMKLLSPAEAVIAHVIALRAVAEEAAPAAEGAVAATTAEPEVIKKGKKEEEGAAATEKEKKK
jgi:large subunit ribosomal protein L25